MFTEQRLQSHMAGVITTLSKMPSQDVEKFLIDFKAVYSQLRATLGKNVSLNTSVISIAVPGGHISVPVNQTTIEAIEKMIERRGTAERGSVPTEEMVSIGANSIGGSDGNLLLLKSGDTLWFEGVANGQIIASADAEVTPRALDFSVVQEIDLDNYVGITDMTIDSGTFGAGTILRHGDELYYRSRHSSLDLYIARPLGESKPVYLSRK